MALVFGDRVLPVVWEYLEGLMKYYGFIDKTSAFTVALLVSLLFAYLATLADLHIIIGGFVAGMFLRQAQLEEEIYNHMHTVIYDLAIGFFAPIFFVVVGFELTLSVFTQEFGLLALMIVLAFVGKIVGSWLFSLPTKLSSREGLVIGFGMNGRGTVEIIIVSIALSMGVISQELFSVLVFVAIFTTALVPVTMKIGIDWLEEAGELVFLEESTIEETN